MKNGKAKVGRNDPCPCGSGLKYKKCHGKLLDRPMRPIPPEIRGMLQAHEAREVLRQSQQGRGRPIISAEFQGYRLTAVGRQLHYSKIHKTFIDFLGDYIRSVLDPEWGNAEIAKPLEERHTILQWYDAICSLHRRVRLGTGEIVSVQENGLLSAYYGLAYNLYLLQHNVELQGYLVARLKRAESFYAAYYETFVAAWFILAGFSLRLEDEQDSTRTHPEFVASRDGQSYSVEAKTRQPGKNHFDVGNQLYKALKIEAHHPRVVFVDMNVGPEVGVDELAEKALASVQSRREKLLIQGSAAPPARVFVTNQPCHLALDTTNLPRICIPIGFKLDDFGFSAPFPTYTAAYKALKKYEPLYDVQKAMVSYTIPVTFDGELPEFAFGQTERRFLIGARIEIEEGRFGTLQSGIVVESERRVYLVVNADDGAGHIMVAELTEAELTAYRAHPDTFFGRVERVPKPAHHPLAIFEFFVEGYKNAPRDRLLDLMAGAPNIEQLRELSDEDLLHHYAEGLTHQLVRERSPE